MKKCHGGSQREIAAALGIAAVLLALGVIACGKEISQADMNRAQETLLPFKQQLKAALVEALEEGPGNAIGVCKVEAPKIAESLSRSGVKMGRTSHRVRNPANAPAPWMEPLLAAYQENPDQWQARAVDLGDGKFGYVEPIYAEPHCLSCHGPSISGSLAESLAEFYPEDRATGFRDGDFRGMFWVIMPRSDT